MKYGGLTFGQVEAVVNKLGGMEGVQRFLSGASVVKDAVVAFQRDLRKEGYEPLEDVPFDGQPFTPDIIGFLKSGESYVNGDVMRTRAREANANLGHLHAEYLLNHQDLIPTEWRGKYYLVFPGTVWRSRGGRRRVPCLGWHGDRWCLRFAWLGHGWYSVDRLVSLRK